MTCISFYSFYLRLTKAGRERGGAVIPGAGGLFLASMSFHNSSGPRNVIHSAPFHLLGLIPLKASQSGGRRKGRGRDARQEGIADKNKDPANSGSPCSRPPRGAGFQQHEKTVREEGLQELPLLAVWPGHRGAVAMQQRLIKTINKPQSPITRSSLFRHALLRGKEPGPCLLPITGSSATQRD